MAGEVQGEKYDAGQATATECNGNVAVRLINLLNEDLRRHLEAIMVCVNYCEMLGGNADRNIARQLTNQLHSEVQKALNSAERICSLGGQPELNPCVAQGSDSTEEMLRFKLEDRLRTSAVT
jgi:bacterioferritin (cytochrome b1)